MNISNFKKLSQNDQTTTLEHPKGHKVIVAHKALSPELRSQLASMPQHFDDGGEVDKAPVVVNVNTPDPNEVVNSSGPAIPAYPQPAAPVAQVPVEQMVHQPVSPLNVPVMSPSMPVNPQRSDMQLPATHAVAMPSMNGGEGYDVLKRGIGEQKAGLNAEAQAMKAQGDAEAQALAAQQEQQQMAMKHYNDTSARLNEERAGLLHDIQESHVDPNRYMSNLGIGGKIATAIGLMMGGVGSAMAHQENSALNFMNAQINRDIEAQKDDINNKNTLLHANLQQFGNLKDATDMTRVMLTDMTSMKLKEAAAKAMDPLAKARAMQGAGQLDMQSANAVSAMAKEKAENAMLASQGPDLDPSRLVAIKVPKEHQAKAFEEVAKAQNISKNSDKILAAFKNAASQIKLLPGDRSAVKAFHQLLLPNFKAIDGTVRQAAMDETFHNLTPQAFDSPATTESKLKGTQDWMHNESATPILNGYGIDLQKFRSTTDDPYQKLGDRDRAKVDYAKSHPEDKNSAIWLKKLGMR